MSKLEKRLFAANCILLTTRWIAMVAMLWTELARPVWAISGRLLLVGALANYVVMVAEAVRDNRA